MSDRSGEEELYDLKPDPPSRKVTASQPPSQQTTLAYRAPKDDAPASADTDTLKNLYMPLWLLGGGVIVEIVGAMLRERDAEAAIAYVGVNLIVGTVLMLIGILLAARWRHIKLGPFWTAVFKLAAISVAPSAVVTLASPALRFIPFGGILGWLGEFVLYFALLGALFDLDESDTWYCVCVIFLVRLAVYFAFLQIT